MVSPQAGPEQFSVLDFGLAVRMKTWQQEWSSRNIAGDPRYFTPAAWMLLAFGCRYLEAHPEKDFLRQYRDRIDHFAVGVLALEAFFALWRCPGTETNLEGDVDSSEKIDDWCSALDDSECGIAMRHAREAWQAYWTDSMLLFQRFHAEGAIAIRKELATTATLTHLVDKLKALCVALRVAADVHPADSEVASVLRIAVDLIDHHSFSPSWEDVPSLLSSPVQDAHEDTELGMMTPPQNMVFPITVAEEVVADTPEVIQDTASTQSSPHKVVPKTLSRMFSHRRAWTVDEAVSLSRGVPQMELSASV